LAFVASVVLAGIVFPFPVLALTALFSLGRIMHQVGHLTESYSKSEATSELL